jgi:hypothetical protein
MENKEFQFLLEVFSFNRGGTRTRNLRIFFFPFVFYGGRPLCRHYAINTLFSYDSERVRHGTKKKGGGVANSDGIQSNGKRRLLFRFSYYLLKYFNVLKFLDIQGSPPLWQI